MSFLDNTLWEDTRYWCYDIQRVKYRVVIISDWIIKMLSYDTALTITFQSGILPGNLIWSTIQVIQYPRVKYQVVIIRNWIIKMLSYDTAVTSFFQSGTLPGNLLLAIWRKTCMLTYHRPSSRVQMKTYYGGRKLLNCQGQTGMARIRKVWKGLDRIV
jgi:hypothetical protein